MAKVLVTCATGFTGGALARRLVADGVPVRVLVRDAARAASLADLDIEIAYGDLRDAASLRDAMHEIGRAHV